MSADVGQQKNETLPGDACDVTQIQDEDLLRKMWQTTEDFGRKKEIRARMYKLREQRLREFYTTGEVLKDVQSVDPASVTVSSTTTASSSSSIREETPKRCGTHYRQLVVGELRGGVENTAFETSSSTTSSSSSSTMQVHRSEERTNGGTVEVIETRTSTTSKLPRLNVTRNSEVTSEQSTQQTERQNSNTDTKIMSELQKLDTFLSATGVDSPTPTPDKNSTFDTTNWTVVSTNNKLASDVKLNNARVEEFVFESGEGDEPRTKTVISEYHAPGTEKSPEVHAVVRQSETKWSGETADGATVTRTSKSSSSYSTSMQSQRISTDLSKDHEAFARSLRSSPERRMYESSTSTRSSSKNSLDASVGRRSPERPFNTRSPTRSPRPSDNQSPRASPEKEQRGSPTRLNRISPTRPSSEQNRGSPSRDTVDRASHMKRNPDKITTRPSPERQTPVNRASPTREVRKISQSSPSREIPTRRTSQTSPTREVTVTVTSKDRESPARRTSQSSPARDTPTRKTSRTSPTRESPSRTQTIQSRASPDKERSSSPEKSISPSRNSCVTTRLSSTTTSSTTTTKERRKLSSASSRAATKRLGTPGASPTTSPTREKTRDKPDETPSGTEDENTPEVFLDDEKAPTEVLAPSDDETESKKSTLSTSTLTTTLKTSSLSEISNKKSTTEKDVLEISGSGTLPRKKSNLKQPAIHSTPDVKANSLIEISKTEKEIHETNNLITKTANREKSVTPTPQSTSESSPDISTPYSSPETKTTATSSLIEISAKKVTEIDSSTLPRKKSSLIKEPVAPQTTPQSSPSPDVDSYRPNKLTSTFREFPPEQKKTPAASPVEKPRSILRRDESPKPCQTTSKPSPMIDNKPIPTEPDDSSRSLTNGSPVSPKTSEVEDMLENTPCEALSPERPKEAAPEPLKKSPSHDRPGRRRSREYVSEDDTSGRESSSSPVRKQPTRPQQTKVPLKSKIPAASPQRPTKLPVAASKNIEPVASSPDRCCGRAHDTDKPWRQSPVSPKKKSPASPVTIQERKPVTSTPIRRRVASRSPSTSPDRPHEPQTRPGRKSPPQKTVQSPRSPPSKQLASASPIRTPENKRPITERTPSGGRLRGVPEPQRPTGIAKPQTRGVTSPTKPASPLGRKKPETVSKPRTHDDERPPQEFHADETSEDDTCLRRHGTSRIATSTARRVDVVRKVQGVQQTNTRPTSRPTQPQQALKSPATRTEPQRPTSTSRVPTATQKRPNEVAKPRPVRTDSDRSIGSNKKTSITAKQTVTNTTRVEQKTSIAKKQVAQATVRESTTTVSRLPAAKVKLTVQRATPAGRVPVKPTENGKAPVESEDEESCTFSTEEDETVTELEEVRYSSHTVDTEDEDFKARVNARGASLKPATTDIVLLRSSRESSPEAQRRYADHVSEPDTDIELQKREREITPLNVVVKPEQVTDLDETDEPDPSLLSVADRVSRFLTPSATTISPPEKKKPVVIETASPCLDSPSAVRRARAMFETIANSPSEPAPRQTVPDILSRPSVFESPNRGRASPAVPLPVKKPIHEEHDETDEPLETEPKQPVDDRFATITRDVKKLDQSRFNTITKDTKKVDTSVTETRINKKSSKIDEDSKYRTITKERSVEPVEPKESNTFVSTATLGTKQEQDQLITITTRRDSTDQSTTRRDSTDQKITTRRDSDQKIVTRRDSDQKITTRRDSDQKITTRRDSDNKITRRDSDHKFTRRDSDQKITEKPRAAVAPRQESPSGTRDVAGKRVEPSKQPTGGKFGVTLRQTSSSRIDTTATGRQVTEQKKTTTTTTVIEGVVIEQITDLKVLEQMLEKATDYDLRRRLRAQIREVRRLGPSHFTPTPAATKEPRKSSPTRQTPVTEEPGRRPSSSSSPTRRPSDVARQSPTRVPESRQSPTRAPDTSRQSPTRVPEASRQSPTRAPDTSRQSPTRAPDTSRQSPTRVPDTSRQSPVRQSPERRVSSVRDPESRGSSPTKEPTRKSSSTPRDEEDGNRMSSTFIRQASKKFEQESRDESKFATFTRTSSSKKVVDEKQQEDSRFSTFTRSSSNKKLPETSKVGTPPPTERKSSKSELTIELAKPGSPATGSKPSTTTTATRKPSVPAAASAPREVNPTDSITSSYGVGPTDESGRPLFGLRALRRSQQQEPGSVVIDQQPAADTPDTTSEVKDSSGRPLFGLRALKKEDSSRTTDKCSPRDQSPATNTEEAKPHVMPERAPSSGQLRDLVQRHEQRTSTGSTTSSPQKPRAKLRDSFITQEIRGSVTRTSKEEALTSRNAERSNALRAIIQKHETITDSEQSKLVRKDSSRIENKQATQSIHENGVERSSPAPRTEREESPKLAGDPIRRPSTEGSPLTEQTRRPGILKKPRDSPERSTTTTTTSSTAVSTATINLRKVDEASVNKIIEDTRRSSITRSPPDGSTTNNFELESPRAVAEITQRALDKDKDFDEEQIITDEDGGETRIRRTHKEEKDELGSRSFTRTAAVSKRSEPGREERYSAVTTVTQQRSTSGTPPSPGKPEHSIARVGRSGSVKALQQRFQQAAAGTGATDTTAKLRSTGYQKAGLIFRTNSFQHTNGCDLQPAGTRSKEGSPSPAGKRDSESDVAEEQQRRQTSSTSRSSSSVTVSKSFLGNETRVTGVQDILTRMREADHEEVTPGTNEEDREARALLNKFLGAQVLLQGMEPLIAAQSPALVSQVERQRIVVSTSSSSAKDDIKSSTEEDELERIWDEKRLRQLLEASDDYDSRRKIRARLRVVMAENKVTAPMGSDVRECETTQVQQSSSSSSATGADSGVLSSVRGELLPYIVEQLKTSLERGGGTAAAPVPGCSVAAPSTVSSSSNGGGGSSESSEDGPAFDSGTESGEDPRTPSSQTETQDELLPDGTEFNCFMEGLRNSFDSRQGFADTVEQSDKIAELPPDVIKDVHAALAKLRGSLQLAAVRGEIVDPERSEALLSLITRLQSSLQKQEQPPPPTIPPPWQDMSSSSLGSPPVPAPRKKKSAGAGRHTVGVSREELDDARKHLDEQVSLSSPVNSPTSTPSPGINNSGSTPSFRPVHFSPMRSPSLSTFFNSSAKPFSQQGKPQPAPRPFLPLSLPKTGSDEPPHPSVGAVTSSSSDASVSSPQIQDETIEAHEPVVASTKQRPRAASWTDDPSKILFTPAQSVQIAVHKAAINKQLSLDERRSVVKPADTIFMQNLKEKSPDVQQFPAPVVHEKVSHAPSKQNSVDTSVPTVTPTVNNDFNTPPEPAPRTNVPSKQNLGDLNTGNNETSQQTFTKPSGKPLIAMSIPKSSQLQSHLQKNKPENLKIIVSSSDSLASSQNSPKISSQQSSVPSSPSVNNKQMQSNILENPIAPPRNKPVMKENPLSPSDKTKLNLNFLESQAPIVPSTVIWGSILNSSGKTGDEEMCSAQKLLQIATTKVDDLSPTSSRSSRSERRKKMKRANTIDIPKPLHMIDLEDSDDDEGSGNESDITTTDSRNIMLPGGKVQLPAPAPFVPKTENDRKFLAFLERRSPVETKPAYRPVITGGGGNHWNSRFSNLKTNFEKPDGKSSNAPTQKTMDLGLSARKFWSKADDELSGKSQKTGPRLSRQTSSNLRKMFEERDALQKRNGSLSAGPKLETSGTRPPWALDQKPVVVVGSLTVSGKGQQLPASTVQTRRQVFTAPTAPIVPHPPSKVQPPKVPPPPKVLPPPTLPQQTIPPPQPTIQISQIQKLEELQKQQQLQFLQQKQQQEEYKKIQAQKQLVQKQKSLSQHSSPIPPKEAIRGPAPISQFSHAQNSAFRPIEKRSNSMTNASIPSDMASVSLVRAQQGPLRRQSSDERAPRSPSSPPVLSRQNSEDAPVMMTAVSRVMAAPVGQQATVTSQVKRRDTDFEAPRSSAAKNLSNMLQRFSEVDDGDLDPELCMSPPDSRRNYGLVHSSHSTSDMHDPSFQERFSSQRTQNNLSVASSSNSSVGRYESAISSSSPINFTNARNGQEDQVITMRLEIPLVQNTATPSPTFYPTQYYQAQYQNPPPTLLSPPVQRRNNSISSTQSFEAPIPKRDLSPKEAAGFAPLRKCESWHQLAYQKQRPQSLALPSVTPPTRRSPNTKAHLFSKQYEARMSPESVEDKQRRVEAYFQQDVQQHTKVTTKTTAKKLVTEFKRPEVIAPVKRPEYSRQDTLRHFLNEDDLANVDEEFENLFNDSVRTKKATSAAPPKPHQLPTGFSSSQVRRPHQQSGVSTGESDDCTSLLHIPPATLSLTAGASKHSESSVVNSSTSDATTRTEVHTKTSSFSSSMTSKTRVSKATPPSKLQMSPFAKFKQLDEQNSSPSPSSPKTPGGSGSVPLFKFTDAGLNRSASTVKDKLLYWCQVKTKEYKDLKIENFSTSWSNGLAFCALIHHFCPDAFDYAALRPEYRRKNFELAFRVAEEKFDIAPLLDVDDMVMMKKPDWKCVFTYVQSIYRRFKDELD